MKTTFTTLAFLMVLTGCVSSPSYHTDLDALPVPDQWQVDPKQSTATDKDFTLVNWQTSLMSGFPQPLQDAVEHALAHNFQLKQRELALAATQQNLTVSSAALLPSLNAGLTSSRRKSQPSETYSSSYDLSADLTYEIDVWGKLSDNHRRALLAYQSQNMALQQFRSDLIQQVVAGWFKVIESRQQLALNQLRLTNSQQNLDIIEAGYESGLNEALDVYLTRNELANEVSRVASQKATLKQDLRALEVLLGQYPAAKLALEQNEIPTITNTWGWGLPSELISRKAQIQASWLSVLSKDAEVAYRYKQRFPSLNLSSSVGTSSDELSDLLSSNLAWSIVGGLTQPIFNGGTLKANEQKARLELKQAEELYLQTLYEAFAEVENTLTEKSSLHTQYQANIEAAQNATIAESLSFEQYQNGLVSYTTVLDAQTRAYNAQSSVIQLKYQLLNNHLALFSALGGDFNQLFHRKSANHVQHPL